MFQKCYQGYQNWTKSPVADHFSSSGDRMIILHDEDTLLHETVELLGARLKPALESPARIKAIVKSLRASGKYDLRTLKADQEDQNTAVEFAKATHDSKYLDHIQTVFQSWLDAGLVEPHESVLPECFRLHSNAVASLQPPKDIYARAGYYAFDMSTGMTRDSWKSIIASANLAVQAARLLIPEHKDTPTQSPPTPLEHEPVPTPSSPKTILALCRPPGHHCTGDQAGGYCYINNIALTVTALRRFSQPLQSQSTSPLKFAILDLDFHHGNGTQSLFYSDPSVLYVSLHGQDEFPYYTGSTSERGPSPSHSAYNTNHNFPLPVNTPASTYLSTLHTALDIIEQFRPDYLLLSLGFDTFYLDPLGKFDIDTQDYRSIAYAVRKRIRAIDAAIILEGGYVIERLGKNLGSFLEGWCGADEERDANTMAEAEVDSGKSQEAKE